MNSTLIARVIGASLAVAVILSVAYALAQREIEGKFVQYPSVEGE